MDKHEIEKNYDKVIHKCNEIENVIKLEDPDKIFRSPTAFDYQTYNNKIEKLNAELEELKKDV